MIHELKLRGLSVSSQKKVPIRYKGLVIDSELRYDILVENLIVVELKVVKQILPVHKAQLATYMKLLSKAKGILINFHCANIASEGKVTWVNEYFELLPDE